MNLETYIVRVLPYRGEHDVTHDRKNNLRNVSELIEHYLANPNVYSREPYSFEWADEALVVHRKKKE